MSTESYTDQLLGEFVELAERHATSRRAAEANRAAKRLAEIYREFREMGELHSFLALTTHDHEAVRLWAATYSLEFSANSAQSVLENLAAGPSGPIRASASMVLREWAGGRLGFP